MIASAVDSEDYRFAFEVASIEEAPLGFVLSEPVSNLVAGLFLPRAGQGWLKRTTPPRLLLLNNLSLTIVSHSKSGEPPVSIPLTEMTDLESGHALLIGWIQVNYGTSTVSLPYNTRVWRPIDRFMRRLRALMFLDRSVRAGERKEFGNVLDVKFTNAQAGELDAGEAVAVSFFECSTELPRAFGWLSFRRPFPADFLALTNRRVLWISDRVNNRYERFAAISRSGRIASLIEVSFFAPRNEIVFALNGGSEWRIPLRPELFPAALSFVENSQIY